MSRLLTLLLLYKAGYMVGKYISIEKIIEETKESYYDTLEKSSIKWNNNENDYSYFVEYYLGIILNAYRDLDSRLNIAENKKLTSYDRIINIFKDNVLKYFLTLFRQTLLIIFITIVSGIIIHFITFDNYLLQFIVNLVVTLVIAGGIILVVYFKNDSFKGLIERAKNILQKRREA